MSTNTTNLDNQGLEVLGDDACWKLLDEEPVGRVGFQDGKEQVILPVNHLIHEGNVYFRTTAGSKLDAARRNPGSPVAFEVDAYDATERSGWSVLVKGTIHAVTDQVTVRRLSDRGLDPWAEVEDRDEWVRIEPQRVTGRRILPVNADD